MTEVMVFTDGASSGNGATGKGGWAAMICRGSNEIVVSGKRLNSTNNQMEMTAVIEALNMLNVGEKATIHSDSQYVVKGITEWVHGWKKKGWITSSGERVQNQELWEKLLALTEKYRPQFKWIRGHSNFQIDEVDRVAKERSKEC